MPASNSLTLIYPSEAASANRRRLPFYNRLDIVSPCHDDRLFMIVMPDTAPLPAPMIF
jgi:hypothetical protein